MSSSTDPILRRLRQRAGAVLYDLPAFEIKLRSAAWLEIRNRNERVTSDGRGVHCEWRFTSDLHLASVFPSIGRRLMWRALSEWPIVLRDAPVQGEPVASFLIGHRGAGRLPHLLTTLRAVAGQTVPVECIVVEQSAVQEADVPSWVRLVHVPVGAGEPYNRAAAFNAAAHEARTRALIFHDNDMLVPAAYAAEAVQRMAEGWRFLDLKRFLFYLDEGQSSRVFGGASPDAVPMRTVVQNARGGSIVAEADSYRSIGGFDEGFVGWGGEDNDFWDRAETTGKVYTFGYLPMIHLHHAFQHGKWSEESDGVARYRALEAVHPLERIARLLRGDR